MHEQDVAHVLELVGKQADRYEHDANAGDPQVGVASNVLLETGPVELR